jgi:hypothetical protein
MLAKRLTQRGVTLSGGALAVLLAQQASAGVPKSVVLSTVKAAGVLVVGKATATGVVSDKVAALTEGAMKAMLFSKLKAAFAVVLTLGFLATGMTILTCRTAAGPGKGPGLAAQAVKAPAPRKKGRDERVVTAWGKEVDGLQAGLGLKAGAKRVYHHGETVTLVVRVRNVGKKGVTFSYFNEDFYENPPVVKDDKGKPLSPIAFNVYLGWPTLNEVNLAPGKEVKLCEMDLVLAAGEKEKERRAWTLYGTGKFHLQYDKVGGNITQKGLDLLLSKLDTGKLELDVKDAEKLPKEKEPFTAWGEKQPGGVQVGLGYLPGERRAYRTGETVTLVVRVRNVSKQDANLEYVREYVQNSPPGIVDGEGMEYPTPKIHNDFGEQTPVQLTLAPGKESDLYKLKFVLRPAREKRNREVMEIYGTGIFQIQETGLYGNSWTGKTRSKTTFSGMYSGRLELEVKEEGR